MNNDSTTSISNVPEINNQDPNGNNSSAAGLSLRKGILKKARRLSDQHTVPSSAGVSLNVDPDDYIREEDGEDEIIEEHLVRDDDGNAFDDHSFIIPEENGIDDDKPLVDVDVVISPGDKYWVVYVAFYFLGITTLLPWNFFINADKYWMYKFRDVNQSDITNTTNETASFMSNPHGKTEFQASFTSYLAIASNVPATICFVLNMFLAKYMTAKTRMISSLAITLLFFVSQTVLVKVDTDHWQLLFFRITLVTCVFMNSFCSIFQCGLFGVIGKFPHAYTTATMSGQALGGIFAAVANIMSIILAADQTTSAFIYFILGSSSLLVSFLIVTFILPRLLFYRFHIGEKSIYRWIENYPPEALIQPEIKATSLWTVFKKVWMETITAMLTFLVTLTGLPALLVLVVSSDVPSVWNDKYYVAVVGFLVFAIGDYLGRIVAGMTHWPRKNSLWTLILAVLRIVMIPLLMLCNLHPRKHLPVIFESDLEFGTLNYLFGFGNGYLCNIVFINAPQLVGRDEQEDANSIVTMGLGLGLSLGVTLSYFALLAL